MKTQNNNDSQYEYVDHPAHYNNYSMECVEMMELIWGADATL